MARSQLAETETFPYQFLLEFISKALRHLPLMLDGKWNYFRMKSAVCVEQDMKQQLPALQLFLLLKFELYEPVMWHNQAWNCQKPSQSISVAISESESNSGMHLCCTWNQRQKKKLSSVTQNVIYEILSYTWSL